jgi:hypothetical protein
MKNNAIVYHEDYNKYDLGTDHPLIGDKPKNTMAEKNGSGPAELLRSATQAFTREVCG